MTKTLYQEELDLSLDGDEKPAALYVLTAETNSSNTTTQYGVKLTGTIAWKGHFGMNNELVAIPGPRFGSYTGDGTYYCNSGSTPLVG